MNFKSFSDSQLVTKLKSLVVEERKITTEILHFLREVEFRRLYALWGHPSLFEFCTKELGYSSGAAQRRIESMRLLKSLGESEVKKIEENIQDGKVNLTQLSMLQTFVRNKEKQEHQKIKPEEKLSWLNQMAGKPTRECEKILQKIDPTTPLFQKEKERVISESRTELKFSVSDQLMKKLERIRELRAHFNPKMTYEEILEYLADVTLEKIDPEKKAKKHQENKTKTVNSLPAPEKLPESITNTVEQSSRLQPPASRTIPAPIKRKVWLRDGGRCTYRSPETGKACGSRFGLEFEHRHPFSLGGLHTESNLTLHCKSHNLAQAFNHFSDEKMRQHVKN